MPLRSPPGRCRIVNNSPCTEIIPFQLKVETPVWNQVINHHRLPFSPGTHYHDTGIHQWIVPCRYRNNTHIPAVHAMHVPTIHSHRRLHQRSQTRTGNTYRVASQLQITRDYLSLLGCIGPLLLLIFSVTTERGDIKFIWGEIRRSLASVPIPRCKRCR